MKRMLVIGAAGQIGSELVVALREKYGAEAVVAGYHRRRPPAEARGPAETIDCRDEAALHLLVRRYRIDTIFHLAALLSARAEQDPLQAWEVNVNGLLPVLETARELRCAVFFPSSIGAFGPGAPRRETPQVTVQRPATLYGISKVSGELLGDYYAQKYGVDCRGLRFPGLISWKTPPGGGTTDYAVEIFRAALARRPYECYLKAGTYLDMMYMPDAVAAAMRLMEADGARLRHRNAYNVTAMSVEPEMLADQIRRWIPEFLLQYRIDPLRQRIADSWPDKLDDSAARDDWGWKPKYDLSAMVWDMLQNLSTC